MFLTDVDELGILVVPHPDSDVDRLFLFVFSTDLDQVTMTLVFMLLNNNYSLLYSFLHEVQVWVFTLVPNVEVLNIEMNLNF